MITTSLEPILVAETADYARYFNTFNQRAIPWNNSDHLILVHPVLEYICEQCQFLVVPGTNLSLDEGMMPCKGCLSIKVYNPKKPKKYGVKLFFITESNTGYIVDFSVYSGVFSTLRDTVFGFVDRFSNQGYHLFIVNYYNSVSLAQELYEAGVHVSGTLWLVCGAPNVFKRFVGQPQHLARGETEWWWKGAFFVICWNGVRLVPMIMTSHEPIQEEVVQRKKTHRQGRLPLQNAYILYCGYYNSDFRRLSHIQFLEVAGNALINFNPDEWPSITAPLPRAPDLPLEERADVRRADFGRPSPAAAAAALDDPAPVQIPTSRRIVDPVCQLQPGDHTLELLEGRRQKRCRVCHMNGRRRDTRFFCCTCNIALCRFGKCDHKYHTEVIYWSAPTLGTMEGAERHRRAAAHQQ
ncbi:piggyBac transposable element-derived protein 4-like [Macrobrachium nipponense]|uniref:piggyBac transposable element-derived protein 4-like n=1 Tax=Macrobrachium nipponense TaxID=159736 RepID=UPI0030C7E6DB